jgi:anaerobic ribonucleoside-triphosphate reductase
MGIVKVVTGRDVALESWSSLETDGLGFSLYATPSHNCCPVFQNSPTKNVWSYIGALKL